MKEKGNDVILIITVKQSTDSTSDIEDDGPPVARAGRLWVNLVYCALNLKTALWPCWGTGDDSDGEGRMPALPMDSSPPAEASDIQRKKTKVRLVLCHEATRMCGSLGNGWCTLHYLHMQD